MKRRRRNSAFRPKIAKHFMYESGGLDIKGMQGALYVDLKCDGKPITWHESEFQASVISYIDKKYPKLARLCFHVPLELLRAQGHTNAGIFHSLGTRAGVADIVFLKPSGAYHGLVLELKVAPRRPTISQLEFLAAAREHGYAACWTDKYDTALRLIDAYLSLPPRALMRELTASPQEVINELRRHQSTDEAHRHRAQSTQLAVDARAIGARTAAARHG